MNGSDFSLAERDAVYRAIELRRDVRAEFRPDPVGDDILMRVLTAAHHAPSVGLSQPWRFIVVRSLTTRRAVHASFERANAQAARAYGDESGDRYRALRLAGILEAPVNICVTCEDTPTRGHGLGRQTMPEATRYSTVCAIQNLWLAARVVDLGVGWVSILDPAELKALLKIPPNLDVVAYLCLGYVSAFAPVADLERDGWENRVRLDDVVHYEHYTEG